MVTSQKKPEYKINSVNPLYLLINKTDGFIEEKEGDKYLNIALTGRNTEVLKKYAEVWSGIKDCIGKLDDSELGEYDKDYMKIKFNSDDDIPLNIDCIFSLKHLLFEIFLKRMVNIILRFF